jgi:dTDP-4-amino-4,6-dideoxygalactose transaminase
MLYRIAMGRPSWSTADIIRAYLQSRWQGSFKTENARDTIASALSRYIGATCCIPLEMGRQAIDLALTLLDAKPGDGVVLPSFVCESVILPVLRHGCVPQFADISSDLNISADSVDAAIDHTTRAVIAPHMFGTPLPIDELRLLLQHKGIALIEDAAQSLGTCWRGVPVGRHGNFGILSFGPFKSITATRGGVLLLNDMDARRHLSCIRSLRESRPGDLRRALTSIMKFRMRTMTLDMLRHYRFLRDRKAASYPTSTGIDVSEAIPRQMPMMDALLLKTQLDSLEVIVARRTANARCLTDKLRGIEGVGIPQATRDESTFVKYLVALDEHRISGSAGGAVQYLRRCGIEAELPYPPLHLQHKNDGGKPVPLPQTQTLCNRLLCLPMHPYMTESAIDYMASVLIDYIKMPVIEKTLKNVL